MKKTFLTLLLAVLLLPLDAQNVQNNRRQMKRILADRENYFTAAGEHDTLEVAVYNATALMAANLSSTMYTSYVVDGDIYTIDPTSYIIELNGHEDAELKKMIKNATSRALRELTILTVKEPDRKSSKYKVFVYIEKSKIDEILKESKAEELAKQKALGEKTAEDVKYYYQEGRNAIKDLRIGDALKYWYWAYAMSQGYNDIKINDQPASRVLEVEIDKTLSNIQVTAVSCQQEKINEGLEHYNVILDIRYKDATGVLRKVANLDYNYNDGYGWEPAPCARNGIGQVTLRRNIDQVPLYCVYCYDENETPLEVYARIKDKTTKRFASAEKTVLVTHKIKRTKEANNLEETGQKPLLEKMQSIEKAIRDKDYDTVKPLFTEEAYQCFLRLVRRGNASVIGKPEYMFAKFGQLTLCQGLVLKLNFKHSKPYIEELVFRFNTDNLVESVAFRLSSMAENEIMDHENWELDSRIALVSFLEDYQTAYSIGRIDSIKSIYNKGFQNKDKDPQKVVYDTLCTAKMDYIKRLSHHFANSEYIKLNISDIDVMRSTQGNSVYGIRLRQEYYSDVYGDSGYLFMLVSIRDGIPVVHLSVWQNEDVPREDLIGLDKIW